MHIPHSRLIAEWDTEDIDLHIAYHQLQSDTGRFGELISEATDPRAAPTYYGPGSIRYIVADAVTNYAEQAVEQARREWAEQQGEKANTAGVFFTVEKHEY